jgi:Trk K+ transport system NAD-binding subunit
VDVIPVGLGNYGSGLAEHLLRRSKDIIGVDFDPVALERWRARGISVLYGDMADPEIHEHLPLARVRWVVSMDVLPADTQFRQKHGVTVVGIRRGKKQITTLGPTERFAPKDHLIVIGGTRKIEASKLRGPL